MHLGNLDNEVYFKKVFTNVAVFTAFVKDVLGIEIEIDHVETERELNRKTAHIRFKMDLFAESKDHRVIVEIQKVDYDYNYDRFVHYFLANLLDQQSKGENYSFAKEVYTIILITAPYKISEKNGRAITDDVLLTSLNPQTLNGQVRQMYGHKLLFLNPTYMGIDTPPQILDWMVLIHESIHNPENPKINLAKPAIRKAAELAEIEEMDGRLLYEAKNQQGRKTVAAIMKEEGREEEKLEGIQAALMDGTVSKETIAKIFKVTLEFVNQVEREIGNN